MPEKGSELIQKLNKITQTPLTYDEFVNMTTEIMAGQNLKDCRDVILCEQQLQNSESETYQPGHRKQTNHNGGDKLLQTETFYLSLVLYQLHQKYNIFQGENKNLKFQVIYLGAASGVTESTDDHHILNHVEKLMVMFPHINFWWFVDPRPMKLSPNSRNCKHLQCLFSNKEIEDFNQAQRNDPEIRYIVISDIRTPIPYDMVAAPREIVKDVLGAYFLCEDQDHAKKQSLFKLLQLVMQDATEKSIFVEDVIDHDQKYQDNVRNSLNLDAISKKFRAPYCYPNITKIEYKMLNIPRLVQALGPLNSTELRELFIVKEPITVVGTRIQNEDSVLTKTFTEPEDEDLNWNAKSNQTKDGLQSVDLRSFDNKIAVYNRDKGDNDHKLQVYNKSLYETCYEKCTGMRPTETQLQYLNTPNRWKPHNTKSDFDQITDTLFWDWINDTDPEKKKFFQSPSCQFIKDFVDADKLSKNDTLSHTSRHPDKDVDSILESMTFLVSGILADPANHTMSELIQEYEDGVKLTQQNKKNYSNFGCNSICPLFIHRLDILMHIRILLLLRHNPGIVGDWFENHMTPENAEKYTPLLRRLLLVYDTDNNENKSIRDHFLSCPSQNYSRTLPRKH